MPPSDGKWNTSRTCGSKSVRIRTFGRSEWDTNPFISCMEQLWRNPIGDMSRSFCCPWEWCSERQNTDFTAYGQDVKNPTSLTLKIFTKYKHAGIQKLKITHTDGIVHLCRVISPSTWAVAVGHSSRVPQRACPRSAGPSGRCRAATGRTVRRSACWRRSSAASGLRSALSSAASTGTVQTCPSSAPHENR